MDFALITAAIAAEVHAEYPDAEEAIRSDNATWTREGYTASLAVQPGGSLLVNFAIDGAGDDLIELDLNEDTVRESAAQIVLFILRTSCTKHYVGTNLAPDPAVRSYGDGWDYVDDKGRKIFGGRCLGLHNADAGYETVVHDAPVIGQNVLRLADYLVDPRPSLKHKQEAHEVMQLLVTACTVPAALIIADKPDVHVDLYGLGSFVFIEHARIVIQRTIALQAGVDQLNRDLAALHVQGAAIEIGIPHDGPRPRLAAVGLELQRVATEVTKLARDRRELFDASYAELHRIGAAYVVRPVSDDGGVRVRVTGTYDDARTLAQQVQSTLIRKIAKSKSFLNRPLWLALFVRDDRGVSEYAINALEHRALQFAPFEALVIGDRNAVIKLGTHMSGAWA